MTTVISDELTSKGPVFCNALLLLGLLWISTPVTGQKVIPRFENISVNEGLSQSSVYSILQDRQGFMWFGTADGLNRYDGQEIKNFKVASSAAAANSNFIRGQLQEDAGGNIWFSNETGIYFFDALKEKIQTAYTFRNNTSFKIYYSILIDGTNLWIGSPIDGLLRFSITRRDVELIPYPFKTDGYHFVTDWSTNGNQILISILDVKGVYRFDVRKAKFDLFFQSLKPVRVQCDKDKMYLYSSDKIYISKPPYQRIDTLPLPSSSLKNIRSVFEDHFGRIWISTIGNGLYCHIPKERNTFVYHHDNSTQKTLPSDIVTLTYADRADNLWIGTDGGGVAKLDLKPPKFNLFPLNEGDYPALRDYFTKCFFEDDRKRIWFGTHHIGFVIFDPLTGRLDNYINDPQNSKSLPGNIVGAIYKDHDGKMWIGHCMGISLFDESKRQFHGVAIDPSPRLDLQSGFVYKLLQRRNGEMIAATSNGIISFSSHPDLQGNYHGKLDNSSKWASLITDLVEAKDGSIWLTSPINGLFHIDEYNGAFHLDGRYFNSMDLRTVCADNGNDSILWIGSGKGLIRFNTITKKSSVFDEDSGLSNSYIYGALQDSLHNFWLSTNGGLSYLAVTSSSVQNFSVNDGLQSNEFNTGAFYKGRSGNFYFGGIKGFNWFHSGNLRQRVGKPGVAITGISINDNPYEKDSLFRIEKQIMLPYDQNNLAFQFAVLDFTRPQANKINYQLQGWDNDWVNSPSKTARYSNLPPGNYTLRVKSSNGGGVWSDEEKLALSIQAPFWEQLWFYALAGSMVMGLTVMIVLRIIRVKVTERIRQLEKEKAIDAERLRISKDMHDEIGSGLTHIALLSELISTQQKTAYQMKSEVGIISSTAQKLVQSMGEIIWVTHPRNDTIERLLAYLREQTRSYFEPFNVAYVIDLPDRVPYIPLTNVQRRNLFLVTKESLNNALKYAQATSITLSLCIEKHSLVFRVADNGHGFGEENIRPNSNGFKNMRSRMEEIKGTFGIKSIPGQGTVILYTMPLPASKSKTG